MYKNDIPVFWYLKQYGLREAIRIWGELIKHGYADTYDYYCAEHCQKNGYCYGCGHFWAGSESFDFGNGLCSNCQGDLWENDYDEDDYSYDNMPDDYYEQEEYYPEDDSIEE